jgi:hypothetical protein
MNKAIIITGDRNATRETWRKIVLQTILCEIPNAPLSRTNYSYVIIHGAARGIDSLAHEICLESRGFSEIPMLAQWKTHGKAAGPRRNEKMLKVLLTLRETGYEIAVHAFHDSITISRGTGHMVRIAREADVSVTVHTSDALRAHAAAARERGGE